MFLQMDACSDIGSLGTKYVSDKWNSNEMVVVAGYQSYVHVQPVARDHNFMISSAPKFPTFPDAKTKSKFSDYRLHQLGP